MKKLYRSIYIHKRLIIALGLIAAVSTAAFFVAWLYIFAGILLSLLTIIFLVELIILFAGQRKLLASRIVSEKFSLGDQNIVTIKIRNSYPLAIRCQIIDELPIQFQIRDYLMEAQLPANAESEYQYKLRPLERGVYEFGSLIIYVRCLMGLVVRRFDFDSAASVSVYPSFIQLRKYNLAAISDKLVMYGVKKVRKLGHTMEFEKINEYVPGDDIRTLNWKATAKAGRLMVNQYQDERSQQVYCVIDCGRTMKMPFDGLSLLDHAINSCLVLSNVILRKHDKAGLICFSHRVGIALPASSSAGQIRNIVENLYSIKTDFKESDFSRLFLHLHKHINQRSLILLYTNFESLDGLRRQIGYLKSIAARHLLIVIFFENTELIQIMHSPAQSLEALYDKAIAEKFSYEKKLICLELKKHGIMSLLTTPEKLTIDTINQYIMIKSRGMG